ncbi:MAG: hypothetical protein AVDCRST_MAG68-76 [uncultured Gemmatimonadetes bacterium]|uniref:Lipoprotein n=1 Tax=uncultured Gemmatimonadota bacterium TaxID=203437 RepID=A0A6J4K6G5_9BACT|nr:MAG: hypothetical protein AVDCRST_MAG68-76 [uncultured Gemmatimonadota bacterium]
MVRWTRISVVLGAVVLLASACGDAGTPLSPSMRPALQGGGHTAGGNVVGGDTTTTTSTMTTSTVNPEPSDTTSIGGGHTAGGN